MNPRSLFDYGLQKNPAFWAHAFKFCTPLHWVNSCEVCLVLWAWWVLKRTSFYIHGYVDWIWRWSGIFNGS